jgi:hypothetical protein
MTPVENRVFVFGGSDGYRAFNDLQIFDLGTPSKFPLSDSIFMFLRVRISFLPNIVIRNYEVVDRYRERKSPRVPFSSHSHAYRR